TWLKPSETAGRCGRFQRVATSRSGPPRPALNTPYRFGRFELNPTTRQFLVDGLPVALGARALDVLLALVERRERLVTKEELLELAWPGLAGGARLVTVTGAGGSGKTRLALQVAAGLLDSVRGGVVFVPLAPVQEPALVAATIALAAGVRELKELRDRDALLVLDNFEHLL